jgi:hypothetical protein
MLTSNLVDRQNDLLAAPRLHPDWRAGQLVGEKELGHGLRLRVVHRVQPALELPQNRLTADALAARLSGGEQGVVP